MQDKIKNIAVTSVFALFLLVFSILCINAHFDPQTHSDSENRELAQLPTNITWEGIVDRTVINKFEDASVDQFPFRDFFRGLKANFQYNVLSLKENNGYVVENGYICEIKNEFNQNGLKNSLEKLQDLYLSQIKDNASNVYLTIIPDKNFYIGRDYGYPSPDYYKLAEDVKNALPESVYIDIFSDLQLEDYYKTDTHWDQRKILDVLEKLSSVIGFETSGNYVENKIEGFEGIYFDQSAVNPPSETLTYLTNDVIDDLIVHDVATNKLLEVYATKLFNSVHNGEVDGYNVFLSGKAGNPMLKITNPQGTKSTPLVIFRDSYGSSIAPLIAEGYETVYVVDIRSISYKIIGEKTMPDGSDNPYYIDFTNTDVLFLFSSLVLESGSFK